MRRAGGKELEERIWTPDSGGIIRTGYWSWKNRRKLDKESWTRVGKDDEGI